MKTIDKQTCSILVSADRYLLQNMDWFEEELGEYEDDYLIIDCPGTTTLLCNSTFSTPRSLKLILQTFYLCYRPD